MRGRERRRDTQLVNSQLCFSLEELRQHHPTALTISARSSCPSQFSSNASNKPAQMCSILLIVEPLNNGHVGTSHFVLYSSFQRLKCTSIIQEELQSVFFIGRFSLYYECPLSEVLLYIHTTEI